MRTNYGKIVVMAVATVILFAGALPCIAAEIKEGIWGEGRPHHGSGRVGKAPTRAGMELTAEQIDRIMERLEQTNPEKAKELTKLRKKNPEKFRVELKKVMHKSFGGYGGQMGRAGGGYGGSMEAMHQRQAGYVARRPGKPGAGPGMEPRRGMIRDAHEEYLEWLKKDYPEEAKELAELRKSKPELYNTRCRLGMKKHRRIMEASKRNPELAKVLKEDLELKQQRDSLLRKIRSAANKDEKNQLVNKLEGVVSNRFDLLVRRKEMEYKQLLKKLDDLKEEVKQNELSVEKWKDAEFKKKNVKDRLGELVNRVSEFDWN